MGLDMSLNIKIGSMRTGKNNLITDVKGVKVGHKTLSQGDIQTGVTALIPREENIFLSKYPAGVHVINGFGKTTGLVQVQELGNIETPIILTNTLSVGTAYTALVKYMLENNKDIGDTTGTVNPIICECNDGKLNDIRGLHIKEEDVFDAIKDAKVDFEEGAVGAGRGMVCHGLSGGIGSASRVFEIDDIEYTLGALVLSNHSIKEVLTINRKLIGPNLMYEEKEIEKEKGSIIVILATDLPLSSRQLNRLCRRVPIGLGKTGAFASNGSGEIAIAFSTGNTIFHYPLVNLIGYKFIADSAMDLAFRAVAEVVEEAVLSSLFHAETVEGRNGTVIKGLMDLNINL